jgi:hypothetical protein
MSNIKPTRAQLFNGLRKRPTYEEISQEINPDKTKVIYPNRDATFLRQDPRMTAMDGVGFFESMKDQEEATIREQRKETTMRQMATDSGEGLAETKIKHGKKEPQRFDMTKDDDVPMETHEAELTEKEKYKKERTQAKKDKTIETLRTKTCKKESNRGGIYEANSTRTERRFRICITTSYRRFIIFTRTASTKKAKNTKRKS